MQGYVDRGDVAGTLTLIDRRGETHINVAGYADREVLTVPESDMFRAELELFAESCRSGRENELSAANGNAAVAILYAALRSIEANGRLVPIADVMKDARAKIERTRNAA